MHYIDLFSGAGGLSEGFLAAGFEPVAHVELDAYASLTSRTRMAFHYLKRQGMLKIYERYLLGEITRDEMYGFIPTHLHETVINREISHETIEGIFEAVDRNMVNLGATTVDVVVGGPPCQAYSLAGRGRDPKGKENDPRNHLYKLYIEFLKRYQPRMFVFENVPGILSAGKGVYFKDLYELLRTIDYIAEARTLDASDFGVLQKRKRVIVVGWRQGDKLGYPDLEPVLHQHTVGELLEDLPTLMPGESVYRGGYCKAASDYLTRFGLRSPNDVLTQHISRPHNHRDREIYKIAIEAWNKEQRRISYDELPSDLQTHRNISTFLDRYKVVGHNQEYSHTLVAHIAKDGHYYIHPDLHQLRSLSVREAARIQSFPDNFFFEGPRTAMFTQIGNAVPPLLAATIARAVMSQLRAGFAPTQMEQQHAPGLIQPSL